MKTGSMVYIGVVMDRHADPEIKAFTSRQQAIDWVNTRFREAVAHPEYVREDSYLDRYELYLSYEPESDCAFVEHVDLVLFNTCTNILDGLDQ